MYRTRSFPNQISSQEKVFYNPWTPRLSTIIIYVRITKEPREQFVFPNPLAMGNVHKPKCTGKRKTKEHVPSL